MVCAPFVNLPAAVEAARGSRIQVGAQDVFWLKEGAYTGEVSAPMLASIGCDWVIIGHSERRQYFGETDETVFKKTQAALDANLRPIVCVGERLEEREGGATRRCPWRLTLNVAFIAGLTALSSSHVLSNRAYDKPVWAIGTGRTATPEMAGQAHAFLRERVRERFGTMAADACRILYGGSVKPDNIRSLMAEADVDGALVGGASLDPASYAILARLLGFEIDIGV